MQNPASVSDTDGEWFEIYNAGGTTVDLNGWTISDLGTDSHVISGTLNISPGGFLVLGRSNIISTNGGVPVDYQYSSFLLANGDDEIILTDAGSVEQDRVEYDGGPNFPSPSGASMVFTGTPVDNNNVGSNWSATTVREDNFTGSDTDFGSPGTNGQDQTLPVELISFTASAADGKVTLH